MRRFQSLMGTPAGAFVCALLLLSCSRETLPQPSGVNPVSQSVDPWTVIEVEARPGAPGSGRLNASWDASKTSLEMNGAGTRAQVVWQAGDSFRMYGCNGTSFYYTTFTTAQGGARAEFTRSSSLPYTPCYSFYQNAGKIGFYEGKPIFGVAVPLKQTAVPGNCLPDAQISYAFSQDSSSDLTFRNLNALIRFRLSGGCVGQIDSVSVKGTDLLAGNQILMPEGGGTPILTPEISFSGDVHSRKATLYGSFTAGQDYYLSVWPGEQSGFSFVFADDQGNTRTLSSSLTLNIESSCIYDFGTIDVGDVLEEDPDTQPILYAQATAGAPKAVSIAVVPEGFTKGQLPDYEILARSALNMFFATEPFRSYRQYFNVWILKVASNESGASVTDGNGTVITERDTYFKSKWGESSYSDMSCDFSRVRSYLEDNCPDLTDGSHAIDEVASVMIINETRYGGICHNWSTGRCVGMVPYISNGASITWYYPDEEAVDPQDPSAGYRAVSDAEKSSLGISRGDWRNTFLHEFGGHGFSRLKDEYWYDSYKAAESSIGTHSWTVPFGLNISATYSAPPWQQDVLEKKSSLVAVNPLYERIGIYHGGDVSLYNRWRSERTNCMIDNRQYFSAWQRMLIVRRICALAGVSFDATAFWAKDNPEDPLRDRTSSQVKGSVREEIPPRIMPMTPPPVLHEEPAPFL